jgi:CubicO group peptidase (beta-lactamase class C family)
MNNILLIVLLSIFYMAYCQTITFEAEVDDLVKAGMSARGIPAVSLAVVHLGAVVLSKGYGVKDVIKKTPADANTVFGLASCTKAFTTTVLAKLLRSSK